MKRVTKTEIREVYEWVTGARPVPKKKNFIFEPDGSKPIGNIPEPKTKKSWFKKKKKNLPQVVTAKTEEEKLRDYCKGVSENWEEHKEIQETTKTFSLSDDPPEFLNHKRSRRGWFFPR